MSEKRIKYITAFITFAVALVAYMLTMAPTASFWDCAEFIACGNTLGIPHPPGTPFFVLLSRVAILLMPWVEEIGKRVNYISVVASAATGFILHLFIWDVLSRVWKREYSVDSTGQSALPTKFFVARMAGAFTGAFLSVFSAAAWFNAVEAERYGTAMFILVLVSYLGLKWVDYAGKPFGDKLLILICYIGFLGVGIHLYTMLTIPAIMVLLVIYDQDKAFKRLLSLGALAGSAIGLIGVFTLLNLILSREGGMGALPAYVLIAILYAVLWKVDPEAKIFDRWPFWVTGTILYSVVYSVSHFFSWTLVAVIMLVLMRYLGKSAHLQRLTSLSLWFCVVAIIGYSTHAYIPIRSALDPVIDQNNPEFAGEINSWKDLPELWNVENWTAFLDFLERKQYGSESMLTRAFHRRGQIANQVLTFPHMGYGGYVTAQHLPFKVGEVRFTRPGEWVLAKEDNPPVVRGALEFPTQMMLFGTNRGPQIVLFLIFHALLLGALWLIFHYRKDLAIYLILLYGLSSFGLGFYLNFSDGSRIERRERDSWVTSLERVRQQVISNGMSMPAIPDPNDIIRIRAKINKTQDAEERSALQQNVVWKNWRQIQSTLQQVGYQEIEPPNPVHLEVRERQYFYSPAFIFLSMIFGLGLAMALARIREESLIKPVAITCSVLLVALPVFSNYREHDRSKLFVPWDYAHNLIQSCRPNSILFTNGDNDTFPLWFIQEVEGIRKDVRVVNLSLGNTDWYIHQILENEPKRKLSYSAEDINKRMVYTGDNRNDPSHSVDYWSEQISRALPVIKQRLDKAQLELQQAQTDSTVNLDSLQQALNPSIRRYTDLYQQYDAFSEWASKRKGGFMKTQDKLVLDLVQNNPETPIHFASTVSSGNYLGLEKYMEMEGMVYTLIRGDLEPKNEQMNVASTRALVDSVYRFRGLGDSGVYINDETMRLLFNYNSIYIRLAFELRGELAVQLAKKRALSQPGGHSTDSIAKINERELAQIEEKSKELRTVSLQYLDQGIAQFPAEWRNYVIASEILEMLEEHDLAVEYLQRGTQNVSRFAQEDMNRRLEALKARTAATQTVPPKPAQDTAN
jgi:hypothetical protein